MGVKVRERPKGSNVWWVFIDHQGQRKAVKVGAEDAAETVAERIRAKLLIDGTLPIKRKVPTLNACYQRFEKTYMKTSLKPSTYSGYEMAFRVHILPVFGKLRLDLITREKTINFVSGLAVKEVHRQKEPEEGEEIEKRTLSKDSIRNIIKAFHVLLNDAVEKGFIESNPASNLGKYYRQAPVRRDDKDPLTEAETVLFLQKVAKHSPRYFALFLLAVHTGMACGELAGLQWGDIDWNTKTLRVKRHFTRNIVQTLKTKQRRRVVDLSDPVIESLQKLRKGRKEEYLKKGKSEIPEWVFLNRVGGLLDMKNVYHRHLRKNLDRAGLRMIGWHDLSYVLSLIMFLVSTSGFLFSSVVFCKY